MKGKVWLIGAGPGDAGLLTQKAADVLKEADVIVYDALVSLEILCQLPPSTRKIHVGKRAGHHSTSQEAINQLLIDEALQGNRRARRASRKQDGYKPRGTDRRYYPALFGQIRLRRRHTHICEKRRQYKHNF